MPRATLWPKAFRVAALGQGPWMLIAESLTSPRLDPGLHVASTLEPVAAIGAAALQERVGLVVGRPSSYCFGTCDGLAQQSFALSIDHRKEGVQQFDVSFFGHPCLALNWMHLGSCDIPSSKSLQRVLGHTRPFSPFRPCRRLRESERCHAAPCLRLQMPGNVLLWQEEVRWIL